MLLRIPMDEGNPTVINDLSGLAVGNSSIATPTLHQQLLLSILIGR